MPRGRLRDEEAGETTAGADLQHEIESYPADRAFHAASARLSEGISPVDLLWAYTNSISRVTRDYLMRGGRPRRLPAGFAG